MKTKILREVIKSLIPATTEKGLVQGMNTIIIVNNELITFNDKTSISSIVDSGLEFECAINAVDLKKVIDGIKEEDIELGMENNILYISSDSTDAELPSYSGVIDSMLSMVKELNLMDLKFTDLPDNFTSGVSLSRFSVSDDMNDKNKAFCLKFDKDMIYCSDRFRTSRFFLSSDMKTTFLLSKNVLNDLVSFNPKSIAVTQRWIHFANENNTIFSCRAIDDSENVFPNINSFFKDFDKKGEELILPEETKPTLDNLLSLHDETLNSHKIIRVNIKEGLMELLYSRERAKVKKLIKVENKEISISFGISTAFFSEILIYTNILNIKDEKAAQFETDNFQHILMLAQ